MILIFPLSLCLKPIKWVVDWVISIVFLATAFSYESLPCRINSAEMTGLTGLPGNYSPVPASCRNFSVVSETGRCWVEVPRMIRASEPTSMMLYQQSYQLSADLYVPHQNGLESGLQRVGLSINAASLKSSQMIDDIAVKNKWSKGLPID